MNSVFFITHYHSQVKSLGYIFQYPELSDKNKAKELINAFEEKRVLKRVNRGHSGIYYSVFKNEY